MKADGKPVRRLEDIWFAGNRKLSTRTLTDTIGIRPGDPYSQDAIDSALAKIVAAYRAIGSDLSVRVAVSQRDDAHASLSFIIDERGSGGIQGAAPRSGARMGGAPPPPPPATRQ